jgi:hypothetical protein
VQGIPCCKLCAISQTQPLTLSHASVMLRFAAGSGQQSYVTVLKCPASGSVINSATLLAATGQQATTTAHVQKNCHRLDVRLLEVGEPTVARCGGSLVIRSRSGV